MITTELLAILLCPETHQKLEVAEAAIIDQLNTRIATGGLKNRSQKPVAEKLDGGLIREDRRLLYPVRQDVPVMLIDEAIPLA